MKLDHPIIIRIRQRWRVYSVAMLALYLLGVFTIGEAINNVPVIGALFTMMGALGLMGTVFAFMNRTTTKADNK